MTKLLRKISTASLGFTKPALQEMVMKDKESQHFLYRVFGQVNGTKAGDGDNGPYLALMGQFQAQTNDSQVFNGAKLFMPEYLTELVAGQLSDENTSVEFAIDIFVQYDAQSATSYTYVGQPVLEAEGASPLDRIAGNLPPMPSAPQLEAPKSSAKK